MKHRFNNDFAICTGVERRPGVSRHNMGHFGNGVVRRP